MTRWQKLAETNPSATPGQQALMGLMVVVELENAAPPCEVGPEADPGPHADTAPSVESRRTS